jgi:putative flippase GtrA
MLADAARFAIGGGANTLLTLLLYWGLLRMMGYAAAYTTSFAVGIVTGFALNTWFVFRTRWSWRKFFAYPWLHALNYVVGLGLLALLVRLLGVDARIAPVIVVCITLPMMFVLVRLLIKPEP